MTALLTTLALFAFAGNSILCRLALRSTTIDPASFTTVRIASAAIALMLMTASASTQKAGSWASALALFVYAAAFSFAYVELPTGIGALFLFGAVQLTMIGWGFLRGERLRPLQFAGMAAAVIGLAALLLPHGTGGAPLPVAAAALMLLAGAAWGVYSLRGRGTGNPFAATRANFLMAVPMAAALIAIFPPQQIDLRGVALAATSGAVTSGAGYMIWYLVLPRLSATQAGAVQLCVPVLAALVGYLLLGEALTPGQGLAAAVVIAGVMLIMRKQPGAR